MQRYKILHRTYYNFSSTVTLGPHFLRLRPREDYELRIESFSLNITPNATLLWHRDAEGNSVATATFDTATQQLVFESELIIQQYNEAPLNFMVADYAVHYPFNYTQDDQVLLSPYMQLPDQDTQQQIKQWTQQLWQAGEKILQHRFLPRLRPIIYGRRKVHGNGSALCHRLFARAGPRCRGRNPRMGRGLFARRRLEGLRPDYWRHGRYRSYSRRRCAAV